ncbi:aminoglycoside nucleotidyltransferase ANT(9) [Massilibacteroides vaginae]|uniref:aminoglycoside nucleotidyltransferase ANT(9) n=1 Tax=Massilibacteroides vaginae TaxID=1673718 RepID=UPI000A1C8FC3|nr:aminoglycoside nucleotidyltransferase ANT(9) [Massilibacteroides vaginae]
MRNNINLENVPNQAIQAQEVIEGLLGNQLIGIYLYGSAIHGGLNINSDIDILVISNQGLSKTTRNELTKRLMLVSGKIGCKNKRPLEVTIINQNDVVPWQFPPKCEYMYGEWLREQMEAGEIPQASHNPDVAILLWQARKYSLSLKGLEVTKIIEPILMADVQKAIGCSLPELIAGVKGDERNVLLTLARMWFTLSTGEICPKDKAAEWVIPKLPKNLATLLETARKAYLGECDDYWNDLEAETTSLISFMNKSIENLLNNTDNA